MCFATQAEKSAEAHDQRTPPSGIDMRAWAALVQQALVNVQLHNVHFEAVRIHVLTERPNVVHDPFHLYWAFANLRRTNRHRIDRCESGCLEFFMLIAISPRS